MNIFISTTAIFVAAIKTKQHFHPRKNAAITSVAGAAKKVSKDSKGSFLLKAEDMNSERNRVINDFINSLRQRSSKINKNDEIGHQIIATRDQQLGPNVSVFYKQDGGLVITSGQGFC